MLSGDIFGHVLQILFLLMFWNRESIVIFNSMDFTFIPNENEKIGFKLIKPSSLVIFPYQLQSRIYVLQCCSALIHFTISLIHVTGWNLGWDLRSACNHSCRQALIHPVWHTATLLKIFFICNVFYSVKNAQRMRLKQQKGGEHTCFLRLTSYTLAVFCLIWYKAHRTVPRAFWLLKFVSKPQSDCCVSAAGGGCHCHRVVCDHWQCQSRHYSCSRLWCLTRYAFCSFGFVLDQTGITVPCVGCWFEFVFKAQCSYCRDHCLRGDTWTRAYRLLCTLGCWHFSSLTCYTFVICGFVLQTGVMCVRLPKCGCLFRGVFTCRKTTYCRSCIDLCACNRLCRRRGVCFHRRKA